MQFYIYNQFLGNLKHFFCLHSCYYFVCCYKQIHRRYKYNAFAIASSVAIFNSNLLHWHSFILSHRLWYKLNAFIAPSSVANFVHSYINFIIMCNFLFSSQTGCNKQYQAVPHSTKQYNDYIRKHTSRSSSFILEGARLLRSFFLTFLFLSTESA